MTRRHSTEDVRAFIVYELSHAQTSIVELVVRRFGITRQAAARHVRKLIEAGVIEGVGNTRARKYVIKEQVLASFETEIVQGLAEDRLWREHVETVTTALPRNVAGICYYGFTEMVNNAVDHSGGTKLAVSISRSGESLKITVYDNGVGIFEKITRELGLENHRHAILELAKGKLTTDPAHHTGEGIFFSSRMFDEFGILSGALFFSHVEPGGDWLIEHSKQDEKGTVVQMRISANSTRTAKEVFDRYASEADDYGFVKTIVPVSLLRYGTENLISRSQAKRLLARFERFREVVLDFEGVPEIGQAFADEIFRVYTKEHPEVKLTAIRANPEVEKMIRRARAAAKE
jgi:DNA-binding Lrp family transcriptional regulator